MEVRSRPERAQWMLGQGGPVHSGHSRGGRTTDWHDNRLNKGAVERRRHESRVCAEAALARAPGENIV